MSYCVYILILLLLIFYILYITHNIYSGLIIINENKHKFESPVKIFTDSNGFVHIKSLNRIDNYFSLGFIHDYQEEN